MMRKTIVLLSIGLALPWAAATAEKTYKWVDPQGNVSYHDQPPPPGSSYRVEEKQMGGKRERVANEADDPAQKFPVVLYTIPKCGSSCELARAHLQKRKVPFTEKNVEKDVK